jgi:hypothetical protein
VQALDQRLVALCPLEVLKEAMPSSSGQMALDSSRKKKGMTQPGVGWVIRECYKKADR